MGQYFLICNTKKKQCICPVAFDDGAKLTEFGESGGGTMLALAALTASGNGNSGSDLVLPIMDEQRRALKRRALTPQPLFAVVGSWAGDPVVVAGEYGPAGVFLTRAEQRAYRSWQRRHNAYVADCLRQAPNARLSKDTTPCNLYHYAAMFYEDVSQPVVKVLKACRTSRYDYSDYTFIEATTEYLSRRLVGEFRNCTDRRDLRWLSYFDLQMLIMRYLDSKAVYNKFWAWMKTMQLLPWQLAMLSHAATYAGRNGGCGLRDITPIQPGTPCGVDGEPLQSLLSEYVRSLRHGTPRQGRRQRVISLPE